MIGWKAATTASSLVSRRTADRDPIGLLTLCIQTDLPGSNEQIFGRNGSQTTTARPPAGGGPRRRGLRGGSLPALVTTTRTFSPASTATFSFAALAPSLTGLVHGCQSAVPGSVGQAQA